MFRLWRNQAVVADCCGADIPGDDDNFMSMCHFRTGSFSQNTAWHPGSDSKGFTSAGGRRDSSVKQLVWHEGSLYSGDDAGVIAKVTGIVCSLSSIELLPVELHAGPGLEHKHLQ